MKTFLALLAFATTTTPAFAHSWSCDNLRNIESSGIREQGGKLNGDVSWDCLPGDGICSVSSAVTEVKDANGDLSYHGNNFWMVVHVSKPASKDGYKAHLIAYDKENGFTFNTFLSCQ